ncbi:alkaline phosphatase family protein [Lysinibacillus pakistanensis]|uniref:alkaline phosphatase family protein n=1 Tax=Lysinibacillus pakistanensis TaxID=759811 RepID=UPI0028A5F497|nr:alkaline phosphatase family protein [Lysinibacillus pakistanensis]
MKLLVVGIDALMPDILFENINEYPTLKKLVGTGAAGNYDGYVYGYGSHDNWVSMYTGLSPEENQIVSGKFQPENRLPRLYDYSHRETIWRVLNDHGYKVGMWKGLVTAPPEAINGYMVSGELPFDDYYNDPEIALEGHMLVEKDEYLHELFVGEMPKRKDPKSPTEFGYTWDELFENPNLVEGFLDEKYFEEGYQYLKDMLDYSLENIRRVNEKQKVDMFWFYFGLLDYLGHFTMHDNNKTLVKKAIKDIDYFIQEMINIFQPENILVISDHGQLPYKDYFPNTSEKIIREAFGLSDDCIFPKNKIILKARNKGFMTSFHSLKGTILYNGKEIKKSTIQGTRVIDIYPTILELFNIKVPEGRKGYIPDIFNKHELVNKDRKLGDYLPTFNEKVLIVQTCEVNVMNSYFSKYFYQNRFKDIYVLGQEKYRDIFLAGDHIKGFISVNEKYDKSKFVDIVVPYKNNRSDEFEFISIK